MLKRTFCIVIIFIIVAVFSTSIFATAELKRYNNGKLEFSTYTQGADAAFDGDINTTYAGPVTGMFADRSVVTKMTIRAGQRIQNLKVYGSTDGLEWFEMYGAGIVVSINSFGLDFAERYTYALKFLKIEIEYGSIAEIILEGYAVDISGQFAELDKTFGEGKGYEHSGSYYEDDSRARFLFNHTLGTTEQGDVIIAPYLEDNTRYGFLSVKLIEKSIISAIAFGHKTGDNNQIRWNDVLFEVSVDGLNWISAYSIPSDFSKNYDKTTITFIEINDSTEYMYVRLSSKKASISIGSLDIYVEQKQPEINPVEICNSFPNGLYKGPDMPGNAISTTINSEIISSNLTTTQSDLPSKKGCKNNGEVLPMIFIIFLIITPIVVKKRRQSHS